MNPIEQRLIEQIVKTIKEIKGTDIDEQYIQIQIPKDHQNGDYSTNLAMRLAKEFQQKPIEFASQLASHFKQHSELIEKVEVAGPGFLNFWIKSDQLTGILKAILDQGEDYGKNESGQQEKVLVEWISVNPTGPLHIGHARSAAWGDVVCRLMEASGYDVLREYYINDAGNQIDNLALSLIARYKEILGLPFELPQDGYHGEDVRMIALKILENFGDDLLERDDVLNFFKAKGIQYEMDRIYEDLQYFRVDMESWQSEQDLYDTGKVDEVISLMKAKDLTYMEEDALWFKSSLYGDDKDRVLIKADGLYTYLTPDIANHLHKLERGYTRLVNFWGADHHGYIPRMKAALEALGYKDVLEVDVVQMVRMIEEGKEVKMSKRTGNAITLRDLCDDIGVDAVRYNMVSRALETHFDFDLGIARKQSNDNPVYYAQYAYARMNSILSKVERFKEQQEYTLLVDEREVDLIKHLGAFTEVVADSARTRQPNKVTNYIQQLAQYFHRFYGSLKVNDPDHPQLSNERLALVVATQITLKNALTLIGVSAPEVM